MSIGIRAAAVDRKKGFVLNGEPIWIQGANRHQQFPYIGNAASDNAQFRDALKLKEAGFNFVRLAHYPQSPAFLDACDRVGLLVVEPVPGWQFCNEGQFKEVALQNIRDMIRRDRNHPCVAFWEVSLNETGDTAETNWLNWRGATDEFFRECHLTAKAEHPGCLTSGDTLGRKNPQYVGFDIPHPICDGFDITKEFMPDKLFFTREYGDFDFGGNYSTTRQVRGNGEKAMRLSAWNFQHSLNKIRASGDSMGAAIWVGVDYNRGYYPCVPLCTSGVFDTFRLPKYSREFFASQISLQKGNPVIFIASYWSEREI
ncbi:MAG: hypothetical protein LBH54_02295, partial [Clostridiales bacterium]|nr:hypothetical protein [Clostridiales bacterium]